MGGGKGERFVTKPRLYNMPLAFVSIVCLFGGRWGSWGGRSWGGSCFFLDCMAQIGNNDVF